MNGGFVAAGPCFLCGRIFAFAPDLVPSLKIRPGTREPDPEGRREPICEECVESWNAEAQERGLEHLEIHVLPGAYEVQVEW